MVVVGRFESLHAGRHCTALDGVTAGTEGAVEDSQSDNGRDDSKFICRGEAFRVLA